MASEDCETFEMPVVVDYGTLVELTSAVAFEGAEDGSGKQSAHHSAPLSP